MKKRRGLYMALGDNIVARLESIKSRFDELTEKTYDMSVINDNAEWKKVTKERSGIEAITEAFVSYQGAIKSRKRQRNV